MILKILTRNLYAVSTLGGDIAHTAVAGMVTFKRSHCEASQLATATSVDGKVE